MKADLVALWDGATALLMASWGWLTPRARFYKGCAWAIFVLTGLFLVDQAFVLPRMEGWLAVLSLAGILGIVAAMARRWAIDESVDVPRRWIAPIRRNPR